MAEQLSELVKVLEAVSALYRRMLEIMDRERRALLRARRTEIEACTAEKRDVLDRLQAAERRRTEAVNRLARQIGHADAGVTLRVLARTAPEPHGSALHRCRSELLSLIAQVKRENRRSLTLCCNAAERLRAAYGALKGLAADGSVYQRGGRLQGARLKGKLVCNDI